MSSKKDSAASNRGLLALNKRLKTQLLESRRAHAKELEALRDELSVDQVKKLELQLESAKKLTAATRSKYETLEQEVAELKEKLEEERQKRGQDRASLQEKLAARTDELMALRATSITNSMSYHAARESLDRTLSHLESEREEHETETAASGELLVFLEARVASQDEQIAILQTRRQDLEKLRSQLEAELGTSEQARIKLADEARDLKAKAISRINHVERVNSELKLRLREDNEELDRVREKFANFLNGIEETDKETTSLRNTIEHQNRELKEIRKELETEKTGSFEARQKMLEAHNQLESAGVRESGLQAELESARHELQVAAESLLQLQLEMAESNSKCKQLEEQILTLQSTPSGGSISKFLSRMKGHKQDD